MIDVALPGIIRRWHFREQVPLREIARRCINESGAILRTNQHPFLLIVFASCVSSKLAEVNAIVKKLTILGNNYRKLLSTCLPFRGRYSPLCKIPVQYPVLRRKAEHSN